MLRRFGGLIVPGLLLAAWLRAGEVPGRALPLFDAYLAEAARTVIAYRTEIRIGNDPKDLGPGRLAGDSAFLGPFTYRPKTYAELDREERAILVHDPQFRLFLSRLNSTAAPSHPEGAAPPPARIAFRCAIAPEEMLRSGPFVIVLPP